MNKVQKLTFSVTLNEDFVKYESARVGDSKSAAAFARKIWDSDIHYTESCYLVTFDRAGKPNGFVQLSSGGTAGCIVDLKVVFNRAILMNAHSIILFHNHPSGSMKPSDADFNITKKIHSAGKIMDIPLNDHIILSPFNDEYYSFADNGEL